MRHLLSGIAVAIPLAITSPAAAQQPQLAADPYGYRFNSATPEDAYRQGLITRWELERLVGPTPQALQGPSPDGSKGFAPGGM